MKTAALFLSIATLHGAALAVLPLGDAEAFAQDAGDAASVTITFQGITRQSGEIRGTLVDEAAYGGKGKPVAAFALPVTGASVSTTVSVPAGRYAVRSFHDVDGDGKMGTNPFGIPTEPFAFSNDAKGAFGPPAFADAAFDVAAGETVQTITID